MTEPVFSATPVRARPGPKPRTECHHCGATDVRVIDGLLADHHPVHVNGFDENGAPRIAPKVDVWCTGGQQEARNRRPRRKAA